MALTKAQLKKIEEIISRRVFGFTYEAVGERAFTDDEINKLKRLGLLRSTTRSFIGDPILLGKVTALLPPTKRTAVDFEQMKKLARSAGPLSGVEKKAIQFAEERAGEYIKGIATMAIRDVKAASASSSMTALRAVQEGVKQAVANRETTSELKTRLFDILDDASRDWRRVAFTEMNNALQFGVYNEIREKSTDGEDQLVFKRPNPDACKHCKRLYLKSDGFTPKIFKLSDLEDSNIGLKAADWQPTIGSIHPWCSCQLHVVPDGYDFVTKKVASKEFSFRGKTYRKGEVLSDAIVREIDSDNTVESAILSYTGETGKPVEKSMTPGHEACECH